VARAKSKNVKAIFLLGSALERGTAGLHFGSDGAGRRVWEECPRRPCLQAGGDIKIKL